MASNKPPILKIFHIFFKLFTCNTLVPMRFTHCNALVPMRFMHRKEFHHPAKNRFRCSIQHPSCTKNGKRSSPKKIEEAPLCFFIKLFLREHSSCAKYCFRRSSTYQYVRTYEAPPRQVLGPKYGTAPASYGCRRSR